MIRVTLTDGNTQDVKDAVKMVESSDGTLLYAQDEIGIIVGTFTLLEVKKWEKI